MHGSCIDLHIAVKISVKYDCVDSFFKLKGYKVIMVLRRIFGPKKKEVKGT
jgi:hypothetical protein